MELENTINQAWEVRDTISKDSDSKIITAIENTIESLDQGKIRVSEKKGDNWIVHEWIKKAILLSFRVNEMEALSGPYSSWYDKSHLLKGKTEGWSKEDHVKAGFRMVPNSPVRKGSFVGKNAVLMPCFINIGGYVDEGTMIDTWSTVGSCAQIGKNCHISGGVGIGGVLEPLQASPVIIEDNCFIGARSEVAEGVIVGEGSVVSMGVYLGASTKIYDRKTKSISYGKIPPYSVVVAGSMPSDNDKDGPNLYCAVIVKTVDEKTRSKTSVNDLLRE
ncbi:2,3,4,5-tetrahydropyridine-2,6-dicarboxylate N-succinyltransferase [Pelagibacteraceae bacterium]|jgi:2,3,4,5-tetrahydropyridine-2-carboxylate N-succinyltransferase|nr:2,3,4,5-tetrahydropyridine-2,6-dicarboxylate N-succinyltransferase [Pelagibacteraceae bacterium]MDC0953841.1 2,3,4,5-tetrahydropyridine-2,6-dicarboxylate N-succinyltransferase [Pelagibacteraceae bacterium]